MSTENDDWTAEPRSERLSPLRTLLSLVPLVAVAVLMLLVAAVIWVARNDAEDRSRATLISDSVWIEQSLRFHISSHEDMLQRLAFESASADRDLAEIAARAQVHLASSPELLQVFWLDPLGAPIMSVPALPVSERTSAEVTALLRQPGTGRRPRFGLARQDPVAGLVVDIAAPVADGGGLIAGTVSVSALLERRVPWWIAERYAVQIVDQDGTMLAEKARVDPRDPDIQQIVSLDPPLPGLSLLVAPYRAVFEPSSVLLPAGIIAAALLSAVSLLVLQRQSAKANRAEARLAAAVAFRHSMEDSLTVGLRAKDLDGKVLYVNAAFCSLVNYRREDLIGLAPPMPFWTEDIHAKTIEYQAGAVSGQPLPQSFETRFRRPDGTEIDVQVYEAPLLDGQNRHRGWMGSFIEITEQKRAQDIARVHAQTLQRTGRLVTMGEMASTLAHELNQPLSAIASYAAGSLNLLRAGKATPETLIPAIDKLALQADRAGQIIRRVHDFTRKQDPKFQPVSLAAVIAGSCDFLTSDARHLGIRLIHRTERGLPTITADPILLEQVLTNLLRNGIEAMAANPNRRTSELIVTLTHQKDTQLIEVIDNGTGIDPVIAEKLFDPFTSTKPDGMGIGLNICRSIIELHHGQLSFRPNPQGGTIFSVRLPAVPAQGEIA